MKTTQAFWAAVAASGLYILALTWTDASNQVFERLPQVAAMLPGLMLLCFVSYLLRYMRWYWLLRRAHSPTPVARGYLAYLAGFAFTATPGKVGELIRIRYLLPMGVPSAQVVAAFIFERAFDLIATVLTAAVAVHDSRLFILLLGFVGVLLFSVALLAFRPHYLGRLAAALRRWRYPRPARMVRTLKRGLAGCRVWLTPLDMLLTLALGILAWGLASLAMVWLLLQLGIQLPLATALSIYPTAMLAGAASMLPGGIGSTELTIVALLALHAVPLGTAALAAVGIRLASLWFAVACGFVALGLLEWRQRPLRV